MQIDKGIPIPTKKVGRPRIWRPILLQMEIGDSYFVVARYQPPEKRELNNIRSSLAQVSIREGVKVTMREVTEKGVKGIRFWRIS